jgi:hypothetical protein
VLTAEGENFLLTQQTGRYLLKAYEKLRRGSAQPDEPKIKYLENVDDLLHGTTPILQLLRSPPSCTRNTCRTDTTRTHSQEHR